MTNAPTQKEIVGTLDNAARRADMIGGRPASSKQCWFLASLMEKVGGGHYEEILMNTSYVLTSAKASGLIDSYLN